MEQAQVFDAMTYVTSIAMKPNQGDIVFSRRKPTMQFQAVGGAEINVLIVHTKIAGGVSDVWFGVKDKRLL